MQDSSDNLLQNDVPILVTFRIFVLMRIIAVRTLKQFWEGNPQSRQPLWSWYEEVELAQWNDPNELKEQYRNASIINGKRVVFNIHGNTYRLVVDIEYKLKILFIVWIGTHKEYDKIDVKTVNYENKANKK